MSLTQLQVGTGSGGSGLAEVVLYVKFVNTNGGSLNEIVSTLLQNPNSPCSDIGQDLANGSNVISVPTEAAGYFFQANVNNTNAITVAGEAINPGGWKVVAFPPGSVPSTLTIACTGGMSGGRLVYF